MRVVSRDEQRYLEHAVLEASENVTVVQCFVDVDIAVLAANRQETTVCKADSYYRCITEFSLHIAHTHVNNSGKS